MVVIPQPASMIGFKIAPVLLYLLAILSKVSHCNVVPIRFAQQAVHPQSSQEQHHVNQLDIRIRYATIADTDSITDTFFAAFSPAPFYNYLYQHREEYAEHHIQCLRDGILQIIKISTQGGVIFKVIDKQETAGPPLHGGTVKHADDETKAKARQETRRVIALAIWLYPASGSLPHDPFGDRRTTDIWSNLMASCLSRPDTNMTRVADYSKQFHHQEKKYLDTPFPPKHQLYLDILATHPDYQGHGLGEAHVQWGINLARQQNQESHTAGSNETKVKYVTLVATPAGYPVYDSLGFESLKNFSIWSVDKDQKFWFEVMKYDIV